MFQSKINVSMATINVCKVSYKSQKLGDQGNLSSSKRNSTLDLNKGTRIPQLAKITTLFPDWCRSLNFKKELLFDSIERDGDLKDTYRNTKNAALNVDLFQNIFSSPLVLYIWVLNLIFMKLSASFFQITIFLEWL